MIGKSAFGEVYIGEAPGVNDNPDWTTVAIKTLAGIDVALLLGKKLITPQSQKHASCNKSVGISQQLKATMLSERVWMAWTAC